MTDPMMHHVQGHYLTPLHASSFSRCPTGSIPENLDGRWWLGAVIQTGKIFEFLIACS